MVYNRNKPCENMVKDVFFKIINKYGYLSIAKITIFTNTQG
jgi:hypothetical protein